MVQERRDDVGGKTVLSVMAGVIMLFVGLFVNAAWTTAQQGFVIGNDAMKRVIVIEAKFDGISSDLNEIKNLLKRRMPNAGLIGNDN